MTDGRDRLAQSAEGSDRPEGGRVAPALGGGSGAARRCSPGGTGGASVGTETKDLGQTLTPTAFGFLTSLVVLLFILWLAVQQAPDPLGATGADGATRLSEFWQLPLNAMGDALAGLAASLAFLWLIVTAFIQKNELKEQRAALEAQRDELELAREVQNEQLKAMKAQSRIFEDEQRERQHHRNHQTLQRKARRLVRLLFELNNCNTLAEFESTFGGTSILRLYSIGGSYSAKLSFEEIEDHLVEFTKSLMVARDKLDMEFDRAGKVYQHLDQGNVHGEIQRLLRDLRNLREGGLSTADVEWLDELQVEEAAQAFQSLLSVAELWKDELI